MTPTAETREIIANEANAHGIPVHIMLSGRRTAAVTKAKYAAIRKVRQKKPWLGVQELASTFNMSPATICYALGTLKRKPKS